jgi:hypothetical protein
VSEREGSDVRSLYVDSFQRFTPQQRTAWIGQEREDEHRIAFLQKAEERLSQQRRSIVFGRLARWL